MTVTGATVPSSRKTWVIPTFLPIIPSVMPNPPPPPSLRRSERLDLDVHAGGEVELHERIDRLRRRLQDVEQPLVRPDLELLAGLLVDVRRAQHRPPVPHGRQRNRPRDPRARALRRVDDLRRRLI